MAGVLIEVAGKLFTGKSRLTRHLESQYGFYRTCVNEIAHDGMDKKAYADMHAPSIYQIAGNQTELEARAMLEAGKNVALEIFSDRMEPAERLDAFPAKKFLFILHADPETLFIRYFQRGREKGKFKDCSPDYFLHLKKEFLKTCQIEHPMSELANTQVLHYDNNDEIDYRRMLGSIDRKLAKLCKKVPESKRVPSREVISLGWLFLEHDVRSYLSQFLVGKE